MRLVLFVMGLADIALGVLLVAVSGFILQGVYNTGPMMPEAVFYVAFTLWCFFAPLVGFFLRKRITGWAQIAIYASPLAIFLAMLAIPA